MTTRDDTFRANPGFADYLETMLQDAQYREADEAREEEREERDTGTIYTLGDAEFADSLADYQAFVAAAGDDGKTFADAYGWNQFGSDFYIVRVGYGVGFADRTRMGDDTYPAAERLDELARTMPSDGVYLGDDGKAYLA